MSLKKATKRITWTDESVNSKGFWVLTGGIDTSNFANNPIILYNHVRAFGTNKDQILPIGVMLELKIEDDGSYSGLPAFDDTDTFALSIYEKYEAGVLNMASAGLMPKAFEVSEPYLKDGAPCLAESVLKEISICDIASNSNAIKLYNTDFTPLEVDTDQLLTLFINNNTDMTLKEIAVTLQLADTATPAEIAAAITAKNQALVQLQADKDAVDATVVTLTDKIKQLETAAKTDKIATLVDGAVDAKKITAAEGESFKKLAATDYDSVKAILDVKPVPQTLEGQLNNTVTLSDGERAELGEMMKLSDSELFTQGKFDRLKQLDNAAYISRYTQYFGKAPAAQK
jgi:biopolymer transport protein ExbD